MGVRRWGAEEGGGASVGKDEGIYGAIKGSRAHHMTSPLGTPVARPIKGVPRLALALLALPPPSRGTARSRCQSGASEPASATGELLPN